MTKDEQRRALELLRKLTATDPTAQLEVEAFLETVDPPEQVTPNVAAERVANKHEEWIDDTVTEIAEKAAEKDTITADDMRHRTPPGKGCMAAAFRKAASMGLIEQVEFCQSDCKGGHLLRRWRLRSPELD